MPAKPESLYKADLARWQASYFLRAVLAEDGSTSRAAERIGVTRVIISRILNRHGYGHACIKAMVQAELRKRLHD